MCTVGSVESILVLYWKSRCVINVAMCYQHSYGTIKPGYTNHWSCLSRLCRMIVYKPIISKSFPLKFSMDSTSRCATLRKRNVQISYKYACGAEAPPSTLLQECIKTTKTSRGRKGMKLTKSNTEGLSYTNTGARLPSGAVSAIFFLLIISLMNYLVV